MSKPTEIEKPTERDRMVMFKMEWLLSVGYSPDNATRIAETDSADWHLAVDMLPAALAKGVDEETCMRIIL